MKKLHATLLMGSLLAVLAGPVAAFSNHEVTVHFRSAVSPQFIQLLNQTFQTQAVQVDGQTWRFTVPPLKTQEQYSELFASMPDVDDTDPMPVYQVADNINPQAVNIYPIPSAMPSRIPGTTPSAVPSLAPSTATPGASPSATPNNNLPQGTAVYTQIPLDGGGQMLVSFRPGTPKETVTLFNQLFGTRMVRQESFYQYRIQLPAGANPNRAQRVFMLFPAVSDAQRLYS